MAADGGPSDADPVVLVVVDGRERVDRYAEWLLERWSVVTATDASGAMAKLEDPPEATDELDDSPVVTLLDRDLADLDGILESLDEGARNSRVALLADGEPYAVAHDVLVEPITRESLLETVEVLSLWVRYDELLETYYALAAERAGASRDEFDTRLAEIRASIDEVLGELTAHETDIDLYAGLSDQLAEDPSES